MLRCRWDESSSSIFSPVYIASLALLKMVKHGRAGFPMEVMGLMLGEFVDEYTVRVVDVLAMPQSGTGVSIEAVNQVFQTNILNKLKQTGRYFLLFLFLNSVRAERGSSSHFW